MANPAVFLNSTAAQEKVKETFAAQVGVLKSKITMTFTVSRRLSALRQLSTKVDVAYSIANVAATMTNTITSMNPTTFKNSLNSALSSAGLTQFSVTAVSAPTAVAATPAPTPVSTPVPTTSPKTPGRASNAQGVVLLVPAMVLVLTPFLA
jgi:hypothetical protein